MMTLNRSIDEAIAVVQAHPVIEDIHKGKFSPQQLACYLFNTQQLLMATPQRLEQAIGLARRDGRDWLVGHLEESLREERGHDKWAANDLRALAGQDRPARLVSMERLIDFVRGLVDRDAALLLAYAHFVEVMTVRVGPGVIRAFVEKCGLPAAALSVLTNHVRLDRDHAAGAEAYFERAESERPTFEGEAATAVATAARLYGAFLTELRES